MANHERPEVENRPLTTYICNSKHSQSAKQCDKFLKKYPLQVWETQYPKSLLYTTWYVSFMNKENPWILNFKISPTSTSVEYRYPQFIPDYLLDKMQWQNNSWKYETLTSESENEINTTLGIYLAKLKPAFERGALQQGGKSFAEGFIANLIEEAFKGKKIQRNLRPEWLRNQNGKCLELDIFMSEMNLAIEIQGLQHTTDLFGHPDHLEQRKKNDLFKKNTCKAKGIKLIWMDWFGVNKSLMREPREKRLETIINLLEGFTNNKFDFLLWKNTLDISYE